MIDYSSQRPASSCDITHQVQDLCQCQTQHDINSRAGVEDWPHGVFVLPHQHVHQLLLLGKELGFVSLHPWPRFLLLLLPPQVRDVLGCLPDCTRNIVKSSASWLTLHLSRWPQTEQFRALSLSPLTTFHLILPYPSFSHSPYFHLSVLLKTHLEFVYRRIGARTSSPPSAVYKSQLNTRDVEYAQQVWSHQCDKHVDTIRTGCPTFAMESKTGTRPVISESKWNCQQEIM